MLHLFAHNPHSEGAAELAQALGIRRIRHEGSRYVGNANKHIINWGSSRDLPEAVARANVLNPSQRVAAVSNKKRFFQLCEGTDIRVPEWTDDGRTAAEWYAEGKKVVGRRVLNGHSGEGIVIFNRENHRSPLDMERLPLYTVYVPKKMEYRVHFAFGRVIDVQRKVRDPNREPTTWDVRSHQNGFIFVRNGVEDAMPTDVLTQAQRTIERCGLDFGAIDIIYNESRDQAYVLEINSAPGLVGQTVQSYANAFRHLV